MRPLSASHPRLKGGNVSPASAYRLILDFDIFLLYQIDGSTIPSVIGSNKVHSPHPPKSAPSKIMDNSEGVTSGGSRRRPYTTNTPNQHATAAGHESHPSSYLKPSRPFSAVPSSNTAGSGSGSATFRRKSVLRQTSAAQAVLADEDATLTVKVERVDDEPRQHSRRNSKSTGLTIPEEPIDELLDDVSTDFGSIQNVKGEKMKKYINLIQQSKNSDWKSNHLYRYNPDLDMHELDAVSPIPPILFSLPDRYLL